MIDSHCHLEWTDYDPDRDQVIETCRKDGVKAIITSCARPSDFKLTMEIAEKYKGFVFPCIGIHPEFIKEISEKEIDNFIEIIRKNKDKIVGIGEIGLDYAWIPEPEWREKQKALFIRMINLAKELDKPLVIHSRDAYEDALDILEQEKAKNVLMHMFGANYLVSRVIDNDYFVSLNAIVLRSKKHRKVARDMPLNRLLLETDAPWLHPEKDKRNDSRTIRIVAEKIAEIKKVHFSEVWETCGKNSTHLFKLPISLS